MLQRTRRWARLAAILILSSPAPALAQLDRPGFASAKFGSDAPEVAIRAEPSRPQTTPGGQLAVAVVLDHAPGWHSWPEPSVDLGDGFDFAIRTTIRAEATGAAVGPVQWPATHAAPVPSPEGVGSVDKPVYAGTAVAYLPIEVAPDAAPGTTLEITITVAHQSCDESTCLAPETTTLEVSVPVVALADAAVAPDAPLFAGFDPAVFAHRDQWGGAAPDTAPTLATRKFFGIAIPSPTEPAGVVVIALLAAAGGLILNLTPASSRHPHQGDDHLQARRLHPARPSLGLWMAAGVVLFWAALGVLAASVSAFADPSRIFGIWWFTLAIGLLIGAMGVGIMGAFNISLPRQVYAVNPKADSPLGSLLFGVMTAILGLPCFGFVAGALLAGSAALPWWVVLVIFTAIGVGMASPYLVLSAFPKLVDRIPRTGPASELVKQVMGLLLLAAAAYFVGAGILALFNGLDVHLPWWGKVVHWWGVGAFALGAGAWLAWRTIAISKKFLPRAAMTLVGLVLAAGGLAAAYDRTDDAYHNIWLPFTPEALAQARDSGKVVVLDFTAEWCLNCKALKATVLSRDPVKPALLAPDVVPLIADVTSTNAPGWDKLRDLGQTGIPLLVVYGPGLDDPWQANAYTPAMVLDALARARGGALSDPSP
ncbi:MAG: thioredoxin family protein [Phycisphaerales bacterium]